MKMFIGGQTIMYTRIHCRNLVLMFTGIALSLIATTIARGEKPADLRVQFLAGPMRDVEEIVFAARSILYEHWYANIGYWSADRCRPMYGKFGKLCKLNLRTGKLALLIDDPEGSVRDPAVHYDGRRILFSYRKGGTENYLLHVINSDGTGLHRISDGKFDDFEPCWLPDGGIAFVTTRAKRWVGCWSTQVGNIWRCDADGGQIRPLSVNIEQDNTPWVLPDGRMLYMRWEYIDRSQVNFHHLWTMYPDGTEQSVFFGNLNPGGVFIDPRPIPGSRDVIIINSPGHGQTEHAGYVARVSPRQGPDMLGNLVNISRQGDYRDPWAFSGDAFMAAENERLVLMNNRGDTTTLFTVPKEFGPVWLHEPRPIVAHPFEFAIPPRVDLAQPTGKYLLEDVYRGRNMSGIRPGEIKKLMVIESLPKPINFTGGMDPLSYAGTFTLERVLGTVPVEADGSAFFEAPALRSLLFVALDDKDLAVKRMQSFSTVQPGETAGCIGCHEHRTTSPPSERRPIPLAMHRRASVIQSFRDVPDLPDFPRDVQPILDRNCVRCHDYDRRDGGVILSGDRGPMFSHSYYSLTVWRQLADGRNEPRSNYAPRTLGSGGSPLMKLLAGGHYDVKPTKRERRIVQLWLDIGAPYPGTYAALGTGSIGGYINNEETLNNDRDWPETRAAQSVFARRCVSCHDPRTNPIARTLSDENGLSFWEPSLGDRRLEFSRHILYNLSRPEKSLVLLAPLARSAGGYGRCKAKVAAKGSAGASVGERQGVFLTTADPDYQLLLAMCEGGKRRLEEVKRFDMPGFKPREEYIREMKRFGLLPETFDVNKDPLDIYQLDRRYWDSFIYRPAKM
jgi:cytochrome c553